MSAAGVNLNLLEDFFHVHFGLCEREMPETAQILLQSMKYSIFTGGKRFRPQICLLAGEMLEISAELILPFAAAVELVHTFSLIHDDLPCMDNDDWRRGQLTNHRVFGEAGALLAGDALLAEAFSILAEYYQNVPEIGLKLTQLLASATGAKGMIAGQTIDIKIAEWMHSSENAKVENKSEMLFQLHELKTGKLIQVAAEGTAAIARLPAQKYQALKAFGGLLGLAFQLADDILDYDPNELENSGFPKHLGISETRKYLAEVTDKAVGQLEAFGEKGDRLRQLVLYNQTRIK